MSMRDLKEINDIREVVANIEKYPRLVLVLMSQKVLELINKAETEGIGEETLEELKGIYHKLSLSV